MERWIKEILNVPGTEGVFIASSRGTIVFKMGVAFPNNVLDEITLRLLRIYAISGDRDENITEIELYWKQYFIICKVANNILLVTLCSSQKVMSLLRITLNVSLSHLLEEKKIIKIAEDHVTDKSLVLRKGKFEDQELKLLTSI